MSDDRFSTQRDADKDAYTDFTKDMNYGGYLQLNKILTAQEPLSDQHDEMLFIIIHQATELWLKLVLHEVMAAQKMLTKKDIRSSFKMLARVSRIQKQMIQSWDVLATLTPADYLKFRDDLGKASGFQSFQYRAVEFALGNKHPAMMKPHAHDRESYKTLEKLYNGPSLYDCVVQLLNVADLTIPAELINRDFSQPYVSNDAVREAWHTIYTNTDKYWNLYELAEKLVDLEDSFLQWRFRHMKTVERIIGFKRGTGGTSGVSYLKKALDIRFFPELWELRSEL
jgi:tryptophan 2,3-dioxygenase